MTRPTLLLALLTALALPADAAPPIGKAPGQRHPDFRLPSIDGGGAFLTLSAYRGRKLILLNFASW